MRKESFILSIKLFSILLEYYTAVVTTESESIAQCCTNLTLLSFVECEVQVVIELWIVVTLFGDAAYKLNISSTKSMTGHLLGAAGAVEAMACVLSVKNDIVPPTINHEEGDNDPELDYNLNFTFNKAEKREVRAALSNTFGFGGHNCCVVFKKYAE